jgi:hypothetical protein
MNETVMIGKALYGKQSGGFGGGHGWFYIEDNKDNVFRVLPPMKSLAPHGKYAKFYRTHRGFRGSDNKQKPFICIEESDYKTKVIKVHCPVCDKVAELEQEVAKFKQRGATDEQIRDYRSKNIFPFQSEGKYYLNVVNQENKIGILNVGSKMFKALEALATEQEKKGRDITGMQGVFLNFKKATRYKGDRDAVHSVEMFMQGQSDGSFRYAAHDITADFAARLGTEAADLGNLFKTLDAEQIASIVSLDGESRSKYIDNLFNAPEKDGSAVNQGLQTQIPGSNVTAVSRMEVSSQGDYSVQQPTVPPNFNQQSTTPASAQTFQTAPQGFGGAPAVQAQSAPVQQQVPPTQGFVGFSQSTQPGGPVVHQQVAQSIAIPGAPTAALNDDEFLAMIPKKKM